MIVCVWTLDSSIRIRLINVTVANESNQRNGCYDTNIIRSMSQIITSVLLAAFKTTTDGFYGVSRLHSFHNLSLLLPGESPPLLHHLSPILYINTLSSHHTHTWCSLCLSCLTSCAYRNILSTLGLLASMGRTCPRWALSGWGWGGLHQSRITNHPDQTPECINPPLVDILCKILQLSGFGRQPACSLGRVGVCIPGTSRLTGLTGSCMHLWQRAGLNL